MGGGLSVPDTVGRGSPVGPGGQGVSVPLLGGGCSVTEGGGFPVIVGGGGGGGLLVPGGGGGSWLLPVEGGGGKLSVPEIGGGGLAVPDIDGGGAPLEPGGGGVPIPLLGGGGGGFPVTVGGGGIRLSVELGPAGELLLVGDCGGGFPPLVGLVVPGTDGLLNDAPVLGVVGGRPVGVEDPELEGGCDTGGDVEVLLPGLDSVGL